MFVFVCLCLQVKSFFDPYSKSDKPRDIILGQLQPVRTLSDSFPKIHIKVISKSFHPDGRFQKFPQQNNV
jgi:hypothetical protein